MKKLIYILAIFILSLSAKAQEMTDTVSPTDDGGDLIVSIVTCAPGSDVYELCGHAALRIRNAEMDSIWNYGIFDFTSPNFIYRFCKGQTDYMVYGYQFNRFMHPYVRRGSKVTEQVLNLTQDEAQNLRRLLQTESLPQNRVYRYNYVRDNCATRPWKRVNEATSRPIQMPDTLYFPTFRKEMRHFHRNYPWYQFGIDLVLGYDLDRPLDKDEDTFAPPVLADKVAQAKIGDEPLVKESNVIFPGYFDATLPPTPWILTPMALGILMLILSLGAIFAYLWKKSLWRWWISTYFIAAGIAGCVATFLFFFSEHEGTSSNVLVLWLNPFQFLIGIGIWLKSWRGTVKETAIYNSMMVVVISLFALFSLKFQAINPAVWPMLFSDLLLSLLLIKTSKPHNFKTSQPYNHTTHTHKRGAKLPPLAGRAGVGLLLVFSSVAHADPTRPKLVVGIMVDQLRTDYIDFLASRFGKEGFNLLKSQGLYLKNVDYNVKDLDVVNSTAIIYTGNYAPASGIPAEKVYDSASKYPLPILHDPETLGNFTNETYSPKSLRLSTLSDEMAVDGAGISSIYSISPDAMQSIIMAGHAGNSAFWISDENGKWATSTYYKDVPSSISQRNYQTPLSHRLDTMVWTPSRPLDTYDGVPAQKKYIPFRHAFPKKKTDRYEIFKESALVNREVTDVAIDYIKTLRLGQHTDEIDMLNIGYTVAPFKHGADSDMRLEMQDSYLRLDAQLARLFKAIKESVGLNNTLIFLVSTGYFDDSAQDDAKFRIPTGSFSMKRAVSLLNSFLSAKHGNDQYVDGSFRNMIYLDHAVLEKHGLHLADVRRDARDFLVQMSGVSDVKSLTDIVGETTPELRSINRSIDPKTAGDLRLEFAPGWTINDDVRLPHTTWQVREGNPATPAFLMGPGIPVKIETGVVNATAIAPTVCSVMRIRSPNGAFDKPYSF